MNRMVLGMLAFMAAAMPAGAQEPSSVDLRAASMRRRAVEAVIWGMPAVNYDLMLQAMLRTTPGKQNEVVYWSRPVDWKNQTLTPNPDALYFMVFFDTKEAGSVVIDVPPADTGSFAANIDTVWQTPLEDAGPYGADKGAGGKYLILPPGYTEKAPDGYIVVPSETFAGYALFRSNLASHAEEDIGKSAAYGKRLKVYPLAQAANPPKTRFTDAKGILFDSTIPYDARFFRSLDRIVQAEPWLTRDMAMIDQLRSLGIEKGKAFEPDAATSDILTKAASEAREVIDGMYDRGFPRFFPTSRWAVPAFPALVKAQSAGFVGGDGYPVDARALTYSLGYIGIKRLGTAQAYLIAEKDRDGGRFDGGKTYRLHVPPNVPVDEYWSVTVYDRQTHALVRNLPRASRASNASELARNPDGSVDVHFGPSAPTGKDANWVPTDPGRDFELLFRLYGPRKAFFDKVWVLPDVEKVATGPSPTAPTGTAALAAPLPRISYPARALTPAHADMARSAGVPARLANEDYVEALARIVYYWGYPAVDGFGRTNMWEIMKEKPGAMLGLLPGAPMNTTGCLADYMSPSQRWVVTPNNDTIYGAGFANLAAESAVVQTPTDVPRGHYWTVQVVDVFTNVVHQLGSASVTPGGKYLLVGPDWKGEMPEGFLGVLRMPTNTAGVLPRSFAARTPEAKATALAVLDQIGMYPLGQDWPGPRRNDCRAAARNAVYPPGVTAQMIAADPDASRPQWVNPKTFWDDLERMLEPCPAVLRQDGGWSVDG